MRFQPSLVEGRLIRRYKRFLADIELAGGERVVAHCPNPGSMRTCMVEGGRVWLSRSDNPARKLAHTWELADVGGALVCVNTTRANELVAEALAEQRIPELAGYARITREVRFGERSRVDFLLERDGLTCHVEVKSVTLGPSPGVAAFPDSVSARGTRHLEELARLARAGRRAVLLFVGNRSDVRSIRPADEIDPLYGHTLRVAQAAGVEILAYVSQLEPTGIRLHERVPVHLPAFEYTPPVRGPRVRAGVKQGAKLRVRLTPVDAG